MVEQKIIRCIPVLPILRPHLIQGAAQERLKQLKKKVSIEVTYAVLEQIQDRKYDL